MRNRVSAVRVSTGVVIGLAALLVANTAFADGPNMSAITAAIDVSTVVTAIGAIAVLKVGPGFAKWAYNKVIGWFR